MSEQDQIATVNKAWWERMVREGCGFTQPWLDLDPDLVRQHARGQLDAVPEPLIEMYPAHVLVSVEGKDVLCLATGGGQQSAIFGLLGACVTVVDLAEGQLAGDREAAAHYGYQVTTVEADMRDLSCLADGSFDLVYQAPAMAYVPDVRQVYAEVARVLRPGALYRVALTNPAVAFVDGESWDGEGYRICVPYAVRRLDRAGEGAIEFRHLLSDIFNGLLAVGLSIEHVQEDPAHLRPDPSARPGSWDHILAYVPWIFAIVARK
jgi:ubiquinone/menaquinone biosynthesis C-methylase UbiE